MNRRRAIQCLALLPFVRPQEPRLLSLRPNKRSENWNVDLSKGVRILVVPDIRSDKLTLKVVANS